MSGDCEYRETREERLVSLLYEDGDPAELAETRAHLATCAECRQELDELTTTRELLGAWPDVENAPRVIFVNDPASRAALGSTGRGRWSRFGAYLPSLATAAAVVLLVGLTLPFLRFQVGGDGTLHVGFHSSAVASARNGSALVTKADLDEGLAQTAQYVEALMRSARQQDRQAMLAVVNQALDDQNTTVTRQVSNAIDSAFDEIDRRRQADMNVMLSSMSDLQAITGSELQRINAVLASLAPAPSTSQE